MKPFRYIREGLAMKETVATHFPGRGWQSLKGRYATISPAGVWAEVEQLENHKRRCGVCVENPTEAVPGLVSWPLRRASTISEVFETENTVVSI